MSSEILQKMIDCYEAGDRESNEKLNRMLLEHAEERKAFLLEIMDEDIIADELKVFQVESLYNNTPVEPLEIPSNSAKMTWLYPAFAVASIIIALVAIASHFTSSGENVIVGQTQSETIEQHVPVAKLLAATTDAKWKVKIGDDGELEKKFYKLTEGNAHIKFSNGVELSMNAPISFEIKDEFQVYLYEGKVRAHVPESGFGFRIDTPDIDIRDLGTEFGVEVSEGLDTKVHVFNGEVELYTEADSDPILAGQGYAAKWVKGVAEEHSLAREAEFPTLRSIAFQRWKIFQETQLADPSLVVFLDFKNGNEVIENRMNQQMKSVAENHFKVRGRWYRKAAYLIDSIEQGIRLPDMRIEGDFTIQAWIYPDLFESSMSVIMNTERFGPDRLHWQFNRGGKVKVGYGAQKIPKETSGSKLEQGKWNQVSMTYDSTNKILRSFVNGNLVSQTKRKNTYLNLINTFIGTWNNESYRGDPRCFNGKIDEFSIRKRKMNEEELALSYDVGLPK